MANQKRTDMAEEAKPEVSRTEFFIQELERMDSLWERRYGSLVNRISLLEQKKKGSSDIDIEQLIGTIFLVMGILQILPLVFDLVSKWRSSPSFSSLPLSE